MEVSNLSNSFITSHYIITLHYFKKNIFFLPVQGDNGSSGLPGSDGEPGDDVSFTLLHLGILSFNT